MVRRRGTLLTLLTALTLLAATAAAATQLWLSPAKYGAEYTLYFSLQDSNSPHRIYETAPAAADIHVFQDGVSEARAANAATDLGRTFSLVLTAAEMTGKVIAVDANDASAPPLFADAVFYIPTFGHAGAYHPFDYNSVADIAVAVREEIDANSVMLAAIKAMTDLMAVVTTTVAGPNDANNFTITAGEDANDAYWMHAVMVEDATDSHAEVRWIEEYVTSRDVMLDEPLSFTPEAGDKVWIMGTTYGGLLQVILSGLNESKIPVYPFDATGRSRSGLGGVTYFDANGDDP